MAIKCPIREDPKREARLRAERLRAEHLRAELLREAAARLRAEAMRARMHTLRAQYESDREVGVKLINDGYRAGALRCHPDTGGSHEDMVRLTRVRDHLLSLLRRM